MENNGWTRRKFIATVPVLVGGAALMAEGKTGPTQEAVKWSSGTKPPSFKVPANAIDCHHHIYDARFPPDPTMELRPGDALISDYRMLQKRLGTKRNVIVQPSTYGVDNSLLTECLQTFGMKTTRGIAVVKDTVTDAELKRLNSVGVRGVRFNLTQGGGATWEMIAPMSKRFADIGWHIQINASADSVFAHKAVLSQVPCQLVFDHLAKIPVSVGTKHPAFGFVVELMQKEKAWVKLSGAYLGSQVGPPTYADVNPIGKAYVEQAASRLVWGSDWPHPTAPGNAKPDDAILMNLLVEWAPKKEVRDRILVDNPVKLYQFS